MTVTITVSETVQGQGMHGKIDSFRALRQPIVPPNSSKIPRLKYGSQYDKINR